jgi:phage host-nuclease inhibitor protein Gam
MQLKKSLARPHTAPEVDHSTTVARATELLVHGLQETDAPIADLGDALARMSAALNDPAADLRAVFAQSIAVCVESLQSYDRLMQQLLQARDLLTSSGTRAANNTGRREGTVELF